MFFCSSFLHDSRIQGSGRHVFQRRGAVSPQSIVYKNEQRLYFTLLDSHSREQIYYINRKELKSCEASIENGLDNGVIRGTIQWDEIKAIRSLTINHFPEK